MKVNVKIAVQEKFLPTSRHRKLRERFIYDYVDIDIPELTEAEFPLAFTVTDYQSVYPGAKHYDDFDGPNDFVLYPEEIRAYKGKFFKAVRISHGAAVSTVFEDYSYLNKSLDYGPQYSADIKLFSEKSIVKEDNRKEAINYTKEKAEKFVVYDNKVWQECGEPIYYVITFGLGSNHGGTSFSITYRHHLDETERYEFRASDKEEAIKYALKVAADRRDTDSLDRIENTEKHIEIH